MEFIKGLLRPFFLIALILSGLFLFCVFIAVFFAENTIDIYSFVAVAISSLPFLLVRFVYKKIYKQDIITKTTHNKPVNKNTDEATDFNSTLKVNKSYANYDDSYDDEVPYTPSNLKLHISYVDLKGSKTERDIIVKKYNSRYIQAFCLLRREQRTFKIGSIVSCYDSNTGEVIDDIKEYLKSNGIKKI